MKKYYNEQSFKLNLLLMFLFTAIGVILHTLVHVYSLKDQNLLEMLVNPIYFADVNHHHHMGNYILFESLTYAYYSNLITFIIIGLVCKTTLFKNLTSKIKLIGLLIIFIFFSQMTIPLLNYSYFFFYSDRNILPLDGCYQTKLELSLGEDKMQNNAYFDRCFDTTSGTYIVYREVKRLSNNPFDLIKDLEYTRIFVNDEDGEEIFSMDLSYQKVNIYLTTKNEFEQG